MRYGPARTCDRLADHAPALQARAMTVSLPHPLAGEVRLVASPIKLSATPVRCDRAPPLLGEHTAEVLREFGVDAAELAALRTAKAI